MGDRCWLRVDFRKVDEERVVAMLGEFEGVEEDADGVMTGEGNEYNYGANSELEELARAGIPFISHNGAGGDYGDGHTAACGGDRDYLDADHDGHATVRFNTETGEVDPDSLKSARAYAVVERRARAALKAPLAGGTIAGAQVERAKRATKAMFRENAREVVELFHVGCLGGRAVVERDGGAWTCAGCRGTLAGEDADGILVAMTLRGEA